MHFPKFGLAVLAGGSIFLQGCFGGIGTNPPPAPEPDPTAQVLSNPGTSEVCSYTAGTADSGYSSAEVFYPCDMSSPTPATTLTGGFTNSKEQMQWLSEHLTSHGLIVFAMTPNNRFGEPENWATAHVAGFNKLSTENSRVGSPLAGKVDLSNRAITGFSMGGGGALLAAEDLAGANKATVALAPFFFNSPQYIFDGQVVPTIMLGSEFDELAKNVESYYSRMPNVEKGLGMFTGASHYDWYGTGDQDEKEKFRTLVTAFLEVQLKGNTSAYGYLELDGAEHEAHEDAGWFSAYDYAN